MYVYKHISALDQDKFTKKRLPHRDVHMISSVDLRNDNEYFNRFVSE